MKLCPQCNFENIRNNFYCERCGTLLPSNKAQATKATSTARVQESMLPLLEIYTPTLPPSPPLSSGMVQPQQTIEPVPSHTLNILDITGRVLLYLVSTLLVSFGLFGSLTAFMSPSAAIVGFLFLFMSSVVILVMTLILHREPYLHWRQRLVGMFAVTAVIFVALLVGAAIASKQGSGSKVPDIIYSSIVIIYGVVLAATAVW